MNKSNDINAIVQKIYGLLELLTELSENDSAPVEHKNDRVEMLTVKECANCVSGLSEHTIRQLVSQNKIQHIRVGDGAKKSKILINKESLLKYLRDGC